ncbi:MAG: polysaccharide biosynthesis/export family protein [Planctomycetota bacterium]
MSKIGLTCLIIAGAIAGIGCDVRRPEQLADDATGTPLSTCLDHYGLQPHPRADAPTLADCDVRPEGIWQGQAVSVSGAVNAPGEYEMVRPDLSLLDAMAMAEGLTHTQPRYIYVIRAHRAGAAEARIVAVGLEHLYRGDAPANICLRAGDVVYVPHVTVGQFYVFGRVNRPGVYDLTGETTTVSAALAMAGGRIDETWPAEGVLVRQSCRCNLREDIPLDIDAILRGEKEDIVLIPNDMIGVGSSAAVICIAPEGGWPTTPPEDAPNQRFTSW